MKGASKECGQDITPNYQTLVPRVNILRKEEDVFEMAGDRDDKIVACIPRRSDVLQVAENNYDKSGDSIAVHKRCSTRYTPSSKAIYESDRRKEGKSRNKSG